MTVELSKEVLEKLAQVDLGLQATEFCKSPVGARMVERVQDKVEALWKQLKTMDILKDPLAATRVQIELEYAENFLYWMADMINDGLEIRGELMASEHDDAD